LDQRTRVEALVKHNHEIGEHARQRLDGSDLQLGERYEFGSDEMVDAGVTRLSAHYVEFSFFVGHADCGYHVCAKVNEEDQYGGKREWQTDHDEQQEGRDLGYVAGQSLGDTLLEIVEDEATFLDAVDDRGEVVVQQDHVSGVFGHFCACDSHGDTDVGSLYGWRVVDAIARDRYDLSQSLARLHDDQLLCGGGPGAHALRLLEPAHQAFALVFLLHAIFLRNHVLDLVA
jgi:hypothetical protein